MQPEIRDRAAFTLMGVQVRVHPAQADYEGIWRDQFGPREAEIAPYKAEDAYYAGYFCCGEEGLVDLLAGLSVQEVGAAPEGLVIRQVPAGREAVFACTMETIGRTWGFIYGEWLPASGFERDPAGPDYERYPPALGSVTIHVPIVKPEA